MTLRTGNPKIWMHTIILSSMILILMILNEVSGNLMINLWYWMKDQGITSKNPMIKWWYWKKYQWIQYDVLHQTPLSSMILNETSGNPIIYRWYWP